MPQGRRSDGLPPNPTGKGGFADNPQNRNNGGMTPEQAEKRKKNRDTALAIEEKMLDAVWSEVGNNEVSQEVINHIRGDVLRLIHTAIERFDGKPKQAVDVSSSDGSLGGRKEESDAVLAALKAKHGKPDA